MKVTEVYTVEYSVLQNSYHVHTLAEAIQKNRQLCKMGEYNGFVPIAVFDSLEKAEQFVHLNILSNDHNEAD